jgi:hypothetical protein
VLKERKEASSRRSEGRESREEANSLGVGERRPEPTIQPFIRPERVLPLSSVLF